MSKPSTTPSNLPVLVAETPLVPQTPALVLFGRDHGKFRAAWFAQADAEAAKIAAPGMRMRVLVLADEAARTLAAQLPCGRVLPSGRALVPYAKRDLYTRVATFAGEEAGLTVASTNDHRSETGKSEAGKAEPSKPASDGPAVSTRAVPAATLASSDDTPKPAGSSVTPSPAAPRPGAHLFVGETKPDERSQIGLGSIVLAHEGPDEGWWEAEVIGCNGRVFSLRWRDWPTAPTILRKAGELALLPTDYPSAA